MRRCIPGLLATVAALALLGPAEAAGARTVAVTYFDNNTAEPRFDPLGRGLADMLITDLAQVEGLTVVERSRLNELLAELELAESAFVDPATAARMGQGLGATAILTGAFAAVEPDLRIDARLVDVASGEVIAAWEVTGPDEEFFLLEKELAATLVQQLQIELSPRDSARMARVSTESFDAFVAWSQGLEALDRGELEEARRALEAALGHDERFDEAEAMLDDLRARLDELRGKRDDLLSAETRALIERIEAAAEAGGPYDALLADLGTFAIQVPAWREATANIEVAGRILDLGLPDETPLPTGAITGEPVNAWALGAYAYGCYALGRWPEFLTYGEELLERFPTSLAASTTNMLMPTVLKKMERAQAGRRELPRIEAEARAKALWESCHDDPDPRRAMGWCRDAIQTRVDAGLPVEEYWYEQWIRHAESVCDVAALEELVGIAEGVGPDLVDYASRYLEDAREDAADADEAVEKLKEEERPSRIASLIRDLRYGGRQEEAYAALDRALAQFPDEEVLLQLAVTVPVHFGDLPRAEQALQAWRDTGAAGRTTRDEVRDVEELREGLQTVAEFEPYRLHQLADEYQRAGLGREAGDAWMTVAHEYPEYHNVPAPTALHRAGGAYLLMQETTLARAAWQELLERYPEAAQATGVSATLQTLPR